MSAEQIDVEAIRARDARYATLDGAPFMSFESPRQVFADRRELLDAYVELLAELKKTLASLDEFGWHKHRCASISDHSADTRWPEIECTCGFDAALAQQEKQT